MQNDKGIMGVGCFAKPPTPARVLKRAMEAYMLAPLEALEDAVGMKSGQNPGTLWLRHLISGQSTAAPADREEDLAPGAISGFFLGMGPRGLKLSIFTGRRGTERRHRTACLDEVAALRRRHLH